MRNRVSFSYVGDYNTVYDAYSYTVFIAYSDNDIWRNGIKYTYLKDNVGSYVVHNFGTSYIRQEGKNHIAYLYENEYDRYKYEITEDQSKNNEKSILSSNENDVYNESLHTYIYANSSEYTYFPSFIEGFTGENYEYNKIAYSYATNNMPIDTDTFSAEDNDYGFSIGDLITNIRGTYNESADKIYKIIGVGFSDENISSNMMINNDYNHIINAYIYGSYIENNQVHIGRIINSDLYNSLNITMPGITTGYEVVHTDECAYLNINESMRNIGNVLIKLDLNWKNNNYVLYKKLEFSHETNNIGKIETIDFFVNNRSNPRRQFLEGDNINKLRIMTNPQTAAGTVWAYINNSDSNISAYYIGQTHKEYNTPEYRQYSFDNSYYVTGFENNNDKIETEFTYIYNNSNNNFEAHQKVNYPVCKLEATDINISYKIGSNPEVSFNNVDIYNNNNAVNVSGNFKISPQYSYQLHPDSSYNIVKVSYTHNKGIGNNIEKIYGVNGLSFNNNDKNTYSFNFNNINDPGKYEFFYKMKNGLSEVNFASNPNSFASLSLYNIKDYFKEIVTYEGSSYMIEHNDSYIYDNLSEYFANETQINSSSFNFEDWTKNYSYIDICDNDNNYLCNIGTLKVFNQTNIRGDVNNDGVVDISDVNLVINRMLGKVEGNYDVTGDDMVDIADVNAVINIMLGKKDNGVTISPIDSTSYFNIPYKRNDNYYFKELHNYDIKLYKIYLSNLLYLKQNTSTSKRRDYLGGNDISSETIEQTFGRIDISSKTPDNESGNLYHNIYLKSEIGIDNEDFYNARNNFIVDISDIAYYTYTLSNEEHWIEQQFDINNDAFTYTSTFDSSTFTNTLRFKINNEKANDVFGSITENSTTKNNDHLKVKFKIKLNRINDSNGIDYWDDLGFKDKFSYYEIDIYNTIKYVEEILLPDNIYLYYNVKNDNPNLTDTQRISYITQYLDYDSGTPETLRIFNSTGTNEYNNLVNIGDNETTFKISMNDGYITFMPNNSSTFTNNIHKEFKIIVKNSESSPYDVEPKEVTVHMIKCDIEFANNRLYYLSDITDENKKLYQEILLKKTISGQTANDPTFISGFCGETVTIENTNNLLSNYNLIYDNNELSQIKFNVIESENSNMPNGILFDVILSNLETDNIKHVLIPNDTESVNITLKHQYDNNNYINFVNEYTISQIDLTELQNTKLYTNGKN